MAVEVLGGNLYEPDDGGLPGYPALAAINEKALNKAVAGRLLNFGEEVTGVVTLANLRC